MKNLKGYKELFETVQHLTERQMEFIEKHTQGEWHLSAKTGLVDIDGDFECPSNNLRDLMGIKFGNISGNFDISYNKIASLEGCPNRVDGHFDASNNKIESLEGSPKIIEGRFDVSNNRVETPEGGPAEVGGSYEIHRNPIKSIAGLPEKIGGYLYISPISPMKWDIIGKIDYINRKCGGWEMVLPTLSHNYLNDDILDIIRESPEVLSNLEENPILYKHALKMLGWDKMGPDLLRQLKDGIL
jgi:hypothetical protein